jgi:hypothetical protein
VKPVMSLEQAADHVISDLLLLVEHVTSDDQADDYAMNAVGGPIETVKRLVESYFCDDDALAQLCAWIRWVTDWNAQDHPLNPEEKKVRAVAIRLQEASEWLRKASPAERQRVLGDVERLRKPLRVQ